MPLFFLSFLEYSRKSKSGKDNARKIRKILENAGKLKVSPNVFTFCKNYNFPSETIVFFELCLKRWVPDLNSNACYYKGNK